MKHLIFTILCVLASNFASAKLVIGKIQDEDKAPIRNVKVEWIVRGNVDKKFRDRINDLRKEYTVKDGTYKIQTPLGADSTFALKFSKPGLQTEIIPFDSIPGLYNEIDLTLIELGAESISGSNFPRSVYEIPASVVIVTREEIADFGYSTVQEILENVPGLYTVDHRTMTDVSIGIRGFMSDFNRNVMIQVNGVSMLSDRENDYPLSKINIPVQAIDKIEIIRGPMSVIYGSGAFFGVINIITNSNVEEQSATISGSRGNPGILNSYAHYSAYKDGFRLSFNAMTEQRDGFPETWENLISDDIYFPADTLDSAYIPFHGDVNAERYSRKHQGINLSVDYEGFFANMNYATTNKGFSFLIPSPLDRNDYKSRTLHTEFGYAQRKSKIFKYEAKLRYTNSIVDHDFKYELDTYSLGQDRSASIRALFNTKTTIYSDNLNTPKEEKYAIYLLSGLAYFNNFQNYSYYNASNFEKRNWYLGLMPETSANTSAGYAQLEVKLNNLQLIAGARLEKLSPYQMLHLTNQGLPGYVHDSVTDTKLNDTAELTPRFAALYTIGDDDDDSRHHFRAMYSHAFNHSAVVINALDVMVADSSNPGQKRYLMPEEMQSVEVGYTYVNDRLNFEAGINLFYNDLEKLITRRTFLFNNELITGSRNEGEIITYGTEIMGKMTFPFEPYNEDENWNVQVALSISLQKTERNLPITVFNSIPVAYSPQQLSKMSIRGNYRFDNGLRISGGIATNYVSQMHSYYTFSADSSGQISEGQFAGGPSDPYFRFAGNIRLSNINIVDWIKTESVGTKYGTLFINLKLENFLDHRYKYPTDSNNNWADKGLYGRGQSFLCTIGYQF